MAANDRTLRDGDLETEDWIEIHNQGDQSIDLAGWHLTDDPTRLTQWTFPTESLNENQYLVVFASGKGGGDLPASRDLQGNLHTNFKLDADGDYLALVRPDGNTLVSEFNLGGTHFPQQFSDVSFGAGQLEAPLLESGDPAQVLIPDAADDANFGTSWRGGDESAFAVAGGLTSWTNTTGMGVGFDTNGTLTTSINTDVETEMRGVNASAYLRAPFTVSNPLTVTGLTMPITYDDGFVAYLNGSEVARRCAPTTVTFQSTANPCAGSPADTVLDFNAAQDIVTSAGFVESWSTTTGAMAMPWNNENDRRPTLVNDIFANSAPGVLFDGLNDILVFDDELLPKGSSEYSVALVWQPLNIGSSVDHPTIFGWGDDYPNQYRSASIAHNNANDGQLSLRFNGGSSASDIPVGGATNGTNYAALITRKANQFTFDITDGTHSDSDSQTTYGQNLILENGRIGNLANPDQPSQFNESIFAGYVGRVLVFDQALDAGKRQALLNSLKPYLTSHSITSGAPFTETVDLSHHTDQLRTGENILAIQGLNESSDDVDFLIHVELHSQSLGAAAYFVAPTPGSTNTLSFPTLSDPPVFSHQSGVYRESDGLFSVTLTTDSPHAQIRFTINGTEPTSSSSLYSGPLPITASTTLRARSFETGRAPSPMITNNYILLDSSIESADSNLPIMIIDSMNQSIPGSLTRSHAKLISAVIEPSPSTGRAAIIDPPTFIGRAGMRARGNASQGYAKTPFAFETWDQHGEDMAVPLLGMPAESDWILNATWMDRTLMRDPLMFRLWEELGYYSPRFEYVEVYLNTGGGQVTANDYWGIYIVQEKVKRDNDRLDIAKLVPSDITEPDITGGYILQDDRRRFGDHGISSQAGPLDSIGGVIFHEPNEEDLSQQQIDWVQNYFNDFEAALFGANFADPDEGYAKYIDVDSWIDYHILEEFSKNTDAFGASVYMSIDRGGKIKKGPLWDFDGALANSVEFQSYLPQSYIHTQLIPKDGPQAYPWWPRLFQDDNFSQKWIDGWHRLRKTILHIDHINGILDDLETELTEPQARNFSTWNARIGGNIFTRFHERSSLSFPSWEAHVAHLRQWISDRLVWLDTNFVTAPTISHPGGPITPTIHVTLNGPGNIYYTLDGSDPLTSEEAPETPTTSTLLLDFNADQGVITTGTSVNQWIAQTGDVTALPVGGNSAHPTLSSDVFAGGQSGIHFDGSNDLLEFADDALPGGIEPFTVVMVFQVDHFQTQPNQPTRPTLFSWGNDATNQFDEAAFAVTGNNVGGSSGRDLIFRQNGSDVNSRIKVNQGENYIAVITRDDNGIMNFDLASASDTDSALLFGINTIVLENGRIGNMYSPNNPDFNESPFDGKIGRLQVYQGVMNTVEREAVIADLSTYLSSDTATAVAMAQANPNPETRFIYDGTPIPINQTTTLSTRSRVGNHWSGLEQATFITQSAATFGNLAISEINYHPASPTAAELASIPALGENDFEFIEIQNIGSVDINLSDVQFTNGIDFTFSADILSPGERGVIVKSQPAHELRYGTETHQLGQFTSGSLRNNGERLSLVDAQGQMILNFEYRDSNPWPDRTDGSGATLELIDPVDTPSDQYGKHYHWRGSTDFHGTPGTAGAGPIGVVINEVLAHTDPPVTASDSIELYNPTSMAIDIGGWYLSDSDNHFLKYSIPVGTILPEGGYIVFDEDDLNPTPLTPGPTHFALSGARGDNVWLTISDGNHGILSFVDDVHFGGSLNGESFGRVPNGTGRLVPQQSRTLGTINSNGRVGPLLIGEVNYNPGDPSAAALLADPNVVADDLEFLEIYNPTSSPVDLTNWRLRGGVDYNFDAGTTLTSGETLVVMSFNPISPTNADRLDAFRVHYGIDASLALAGGWQNQLNDGQERIQLQSPDTPPPEEPSLIPRITSDELLYDDLAPWDVTADGAGNTLHRTHLQGLGHESASWTASQPGPGRPLLPGDGDFDGDVDTSDLTNAIVNFTSAGGTGKTWADGDTDGDGDVDTSDLTTAIINFTGARAGNGKQLDPSRSANLSAASSLYHRAPVSILANTEFLSHDARQRKRNGLDTLFESMGRAS